MKNNNNTMYAVAYLRHILLEDKTSGILIKNHINEGKKIADYIDHINGGMFSANIKTRDYYFKNALKKHVNNFEQLIILGIGLDTKAYWNILKDKIIFGIDICKENIINTYKEANLTLTSQIIDADLNSLDKNVLNELELNGFSKNKKTYIIWEGGTFYLEAEKIISILDFFIKQINISGISLDYLNKDVYFNKKHSSRNVIDKVISFLELSGEPWLGFFNPHEFETFFKERNFTTIENESHGKIERQYNNNPVMIEDLNYFITCIK